MTLTSPPVTEPVTDQAGLIRPAWHRFFEALKRTANTASGILPVSLGGTGVSALSDVTRTNDTNVTLTLGGTPAGAVIKPVSFTMGWTGQLESSRGGTGVSSLATLSRTNDTNVTLTLSGTPAGSLIQSVGLALGWTGQLSVARGGTGVGAIPALAVRRAADQTGIATATFTKIQFDTEVVDNTATFDNASTYRWTPTTAGVYFVMLQVTMLGVADGKIIAAAIYKNGAMERFCTLIQGGTGDGSAFAFGLIPLNGSTDYIEGYCYHEHGSNRDLRGGTVYSQMMGVRVCA